MRITKRTATLFLILGFIVLSSLWFFTGFMAAKQKMRPGLESTTTELQFCKNNLRACNQAFYDSYVIGVVEGCTWALEDPYNLGLCREVLKARAEALQGGAL
jgi:hypothetical protein